MDKYRKKIIFKLRAIVVILALSITTFSFIAVSANAVKIVLTTPETTVKRGDTVRVVAKTKDVAQLKGGFNGYGGTLVYDTVVLNRTDTKSAVPSWTVAYNAVNNKFVGSDPTGMDFKTSDTDILYIDLKVLDTAPIGKTIVELKEVELSDSSYKKVVVGNATIELNIVDKDLPPVEPDKSKNSKLDSLSPSAGSLQPKFSPDKTSYTVEITEDTESIEFDYKTQDAKAKVIAGGGKHNLKAGKNEIKIIVEAEDGSKTTYTVVVNKPEKIEKPDKSDNSKLDNIIPSEGELSPKFYSDNTDYTLTVPEGTDSIDFELKLQDPNSKIISGDQIHDLKPGKNEIVIVVEAEDGTRTTYNIVVDKPEEKPVEKPIEKPEEKPKDDTPNSGDSGDINIDSSNNFVIDVDGFGKLMEKFTPNIYNYNTTVGKDTTSITPNVVLEDKNAKYEIIGGDNLQLGDNEVILRVTAANGEVRDYVFTVHRSNQRNTATLASLSVGGHAVNPGFNPEVYYYTMTVSSDTQSLGVSAAPTSGGAVVNISGNNHLNYGVNIVKVTVDFDYVQNTYIIEVIREHEETELNIIPWIISGITIMIAIALLIVIYFKNKMMKNQEPQSYDPLVLKLMEQNMRLQEGRAYRRED